jgi:hypothetical protein
MFTTPQGKLVSKIEDINQYKLGKLTVERFDVEDRTVSIFGEAAIVRFKVNIEGKYEQWAFSTPFQFTRVYARENSKWKMVAGHSSEFLKASGGLRSEQNHTATSSQRTE